MFLAFSPLPSKWHPRITESRTRLSDWTELNNKRFLSEKPTVSLLWKKVKVSRSGVSDSLWPQWLYCPWNSPGQNAGVGRLALLQGIFPTRESNQSLLNCRWILYQLSYQGRFDWYQMVIPYVKVTTEMFCPYILFYFWTQSYFLLCPHWGGQKNLVPARNLTPWLWPLRGWKMCHGTCWQSSG